MTERSIDDLRDSLMAAYRNPWHSPALLLESI